MTRKRVTLVQRKGVSARRVRAFLQLLPRDTLEVDVHTTSSLHEGQEVARAAVDRGTDFLVAAGGDGTLLSLVEASVQADVPLGTLPLGTSNDFARHLGIASGAALASALKLGSTRPVDVLECTCGNPGGGERQIQFVTTAGVGVVGELCQREQRGVGALIKGALGNAGWPLLFAIALEAVRGRSARVSFRPGGEELVMNLECFEVCKVRAPGGFALAPDASFDSGILHIMFFENLRFFPFVRELWRVTRTPWGHLRSGRVQYASFDAHFNRVGTTLVQEAAVTAERPLPVHVHGEYAGLTPVTFRMTGRSLRGIG